MTPETSATGSAPSRRLALLYDVTTAVTAGLMIACMSSGFFAGLYVAGAAGAVAAFLLGYFTLMRGWAGHARGTLRYSRLWVGMTLVAAFALTGGRSEPMLFFGAIGTGFTGLYWIGGWIGARLRRD